MQMHEIVKAKPGCDQSLATCLGLQATTRTHAGDACMLIAVAAAARH